MYYFGNIYSLVLESSEMVDINLIPYKIFFAKSYFQEQSYFLFLYPANSKFRHILIGGGSEQRSTEYIRIIEIIQYLRSKTDKPVYLMALPPENIEILSEYYNAGIDEIAFNIEIFDNDFISFKETTVRMMEP